MNQRDTYEQAEIQSSLFPPDHLKPDPAMNLLPYDGVVNYVGPIFSSEKADNYYRTLLHEIPWQNDTAVMFGKPIVTARKVAWYGDADFSYTYSGTTRQALAWTKDLMQLKNRTEQLTGTTYNSCLLNLYHNGDEGMGWHSDDEKTLSKNSAIASLTFGAERRFCFRHRQTKHSVEIVLEHGSLLVMKETTQTDWLHSLPKAKRIKTPRINLTFRTMI